VNIDELTGKLVKQIQQNNGLKPLGNAEPITVGSMEGRSVMLQSNSLFATDGQPQAEWDWLVTVPQRDDSFIFMIFVAPESDFGRFRPTHEAMLKSLR
jgi:hypothetical protein